MTPTVDERFASIIRALTEVILPHLPADASLAQEQAHLAVGHLQILRAQFDTTHDFEREELADNIALASALTAAIEGGTQTQTALAVLVTAGNADGAINARDRLRGLNRAVEALVKAVSTDGSTAAKAALRTIILDHERVRVLKDRRWFLPFGFDTMEDAA